MESVTLTPIGLLRASESGFTVELAPAFRPGLAGLEGFSHIQILWWFHGIKAPRNPPLLCEKPYVKGPQALGVFATRAPLRPNPLALTCAQVAFIDQARGLVGLHYMDAWDGSPVLDLKPYTPSLDRVERPEVPGWCAHWPMSLEASGSFDWEAEFNF